MPRRVDRPPPLGCQLREVRRCVGLRAHELAQLAGLSTAAVYTVEGSGGRIRSLIKLAAALGLTLRIPDLATLAQMRGLTIAKLAMVADVGFDTVRGVLMNPLSCNVRSVERVCAALDHSLNLVV